MTGAGHLMRGLKILNVPVGEERYVVVKLREKAAQVEDTTKSSVMDLGDEYHQELWTMLHFSLQPRITYWLRTCTSEETAEMAGRVDNCIIKAAQVATGVEFDTEVMAKERLRLLARMKGGGIKRAADVKYPSFLGAILDVLPRCVDMKDKNGEIVKGIYSDHLTEVIGEGAFDEAGNRNI